MLIYFLLLIAFIIVLIVWILPRLKPMHEKLIKWVGVPILIILCVYLFFIIKEPIDQLKEVERVEKLVKAKLLKIKTAQLSFKSVNGKFAGNWDELTDFCLNGKFPVVTAIGSEEDTSANAVFIRDTTYIAVKDSIFTSDFDIKSIRYVPEQNVEFEIFAGSIKKNLVDVFVFEVKDPAPINPARRKNNNEKALCIGSKTEVKSTGNWE